MTQPFPPNACPPLNLLPTPDSFDGKEWNAANGAEVERWNVRPRLAGTAVLLHRLTEMCEYPKFGVYDCRVADQLTPGEFYTASAWVWIPAEFRGREVCLFCAGRPSGRIRRAALYPRETWQMIWVTVQLPLDKTSLLLSLGVAGRAGDEVHSTGWRLEWGKGSHDDVPPYPPAGRTGQAEHREAKPAHRQP